MDILVFYRFENFPTIITMPPLPIDMDKEIFEKYKEVFICNEAFEIAEFQILRNIKDELYEKIPEMIRPFFEYDLYVNSHR